ncbi:MazG nucleotide pyrophosphohydrolase domain-containing protein (plasmid) [Halobacillus litoralis]|uniref:MazG nucleotide pyrophosphohydrolase domain-containing protein n=1 Tax=Halobacillus litoralis TaxID=45668 RepID=UPI001CFE6C3A|nr:MazG nucleotide pyrophosphohydrolase domain-containing protein [Halobacillus litoralis]WLR49565.1 MazG nucleotide pyrophosphohydrolase domain-containing protein [Halobacillus litoralis]
MDIKDLQQDVTDLLKQKGFGTGDFWKKTALVHTEVSELADVVKKQGFENKEAIADEVADIIIRTMNYGAMFDIDIDKAVAGKMAENWGRGYQYNTIEGGGADN